MTVLALVSPQALALREVKADLILCLKLLLLVGLTDAAHGSMLAALHSV